jgi:hypothetical protein
MWTYPEAALRLTVIGESHTVLNILFSVAEVIGANCSASLDRPSSKCKQQCVRQEDMKHNANVCAMAQIPIPKSPMLIGVGQ